MEAGRAAPGSWYWTQRADLQSARRGLQESRKQLLDAARAEVITLAEQIDSSKTALVSLEKNVDAARRAETLAQAAFHSGVRSLLEVQDADLQAQAAQLSLLQEKSSLPTPSSTWRSHSIPRWRKSMEIRNRLSILSLATAVVAALVACSPSHPASATSAAADPPRNTVVVQVAAVTKRSFASNIIISGTIGSETEARLSFKTGGIIDSMKVRDGDQVRKGQLLATLNPTEINAQVEQAKEGLDKAQRDLTRAKDLFSQGVATQEQLDNATTAFSVAQTMEIASFNQSRSEIFAPASGVVLRSS